MTPLLLASASLAAVSRDAHPASAASREPALRPATAAVSSFAAGQYAGEMVAGRRHGWGELYSARGVLAYQGNWRDGKRCGAGRGYDAGGELCYEGEWCADVRSGAGEELEGDFVKYGGEWQQDQYHGVGKLVDRSARGSPTHVGTFANGERHGQGHSELSVDKDGHTTYVTMRGMWVHGRFTGEGSLSLNGVLRCSGTWYNSHSHGQAKESYNNGRDEYTGAFVHGSREGLGEWHSSEYVGMPHVPVVAYKGMWHADKRHGKGVTTMLGDTEYEGDWRDGKYHGVGVLFYADGVERYRGGFRAGKFSGHGTYRMVDDDFDATYVGAWANNMPNGRGLLTVTRGCHRSEVWSGWNALPLSGEETFNTQLIKQEGLRTVKHNSPSLPGYPSPSIDELVPAAAAAELRSVWTYEGMWQQGQSQGTGALSNEGRPMYEGEWRHNSFHGRGRQQRSADTASCGWKCNATFQIALYEGEFRANMRNGQGTAHMRNGADYTGAWLNGLQHGAGEMRYGLVPGSVNDCVAGGDGVYAGRFVHGVVDGHGTLSVDDRVWYAGDFSEGRFHGRGKLYMDAAALLAAGIRHTRACQYVGGFRDDQRSGHGVLTDSRGLVLYDGRWELGLFVPPVADAGAEAAAAAEKAQAKAELEARRLLRSRERLAARVRAPVEPQPEPQPQPQPEPEPQPQLQLDQPAPAGNRRDRRAVLQAAKAVAASQASRLQQSQHTSVGAQRDAAPLLSPEPVGAAQQATMSADRAAAERRRAAKQAKRAKHKSQSLDQFNSKCH